MTRSYFYACCVSTSARRFYGIASILTGMALISTLVCYSRGSRLETQEGQIEKLETEIQYRKQIHSLDSTTIETLKAYLQQEIL